MLVGGDAGIGKTTLVANHKRGVAEVGFTVPKAASLATTTPNAGSTA